MHYIYRLVDEMFWGVQTLNPTQLLAATVCIVLLGYIGITTRLATR